MDSSLRARFERLGPIRAVDRVSSGSPGVLVLRLHHKKPVTVDAALTLARRGLPLLRAKRAMEELMATGDAFVELPAIDDAEAVIAELRAARIAARFVPMPIGDVSETNPKLS